MFLINAQGESIIPARGEVSDLDFVIACRLPLAPQKKSLFGAQSLFVDVADGEAQNESPYQAEYDFAIAVYNVFGADIRQLDLPTFDEIESYVDILESLDAKFRT